MVHRYSAIASGRPCGIDDSDCDVPEIQVLPGDVGNLRYHWEKCRLYRIVGAFLGRRKDPKGPKSLHDIHTQLRAWFDALPEDLRVSSGLHHDHKTNLVAQQSVALQLAYDNIQIVLHRQAVFVPRSSPTLTPDINASKTQLLESALRTAAVLSNTALLPICRSSHASMHVAICLFTSGVVLAALCLSHSQGNDTGKLLDGLDRIVNFYENFPGQHYNLVTQCLEVLRTLQLKCNSSVFSEHSQPELRPDVTRTGKSLSRRRRGTYSSHANALHTDLAESILESTGWTTADISSLVEFDNFSTTDLLDYASGSSLQGIAQSWLWSDPGSWPANDHDRRPDNDIG